MDWRERIELSPRPILKRSGVSVEAVLATLGKGDSIESLLARAPALTREDVAACNGVRGGSAGEARIPRVV